MESLDPTLYSMLQSLYENNGRKSWNMYPENNGSICLKIRFNGHGVGSSEDTTKHKPVSKVRRNMNRSNKWKDTPTTDIQCEIKPSKRNRLDLSPDQFQGSNKIENSRNCAEPCENHRNFNSLDLDLSSVDCTPLKTSDQSPLVNCEESITPSDDFPVYDESDNEQFQECLSRDNTMYIQEQNVETLEQFDPYDNDNDSVYDENAPSDWRHVNRPCIQAGCFYRPNQTILPSEVDTQLGHRPNGTFKSYYKCTKCGRIMCNECIYYKMRHLNHFKHVKDFYKNVQDCRAPPPSSL